MCAAGCSADNMRNVMQGTPRWLDTGSRILGALATSTAIYIVTSGLIVGRPWWLTLSAALALPEITRLTLSEFSDVQRNGPASKATQRATRTLCVLGMLLLILGVASA